MDATMELTTISSLKERIIAKAWSDPAFKTALIDNPKLALKQHFDITIPEGMELVVAEETTERMMLVIPPNPAVYGQDLVVAADSW